MSEHPTFRETDAVIVSPDEYMFEKFKAAWRFCYANPLPDGYVGDDRAAILHIICETENWEVTEKASDLNDAAKKFVDQEIAAGTIPQIPPQAI